MSESKIYTAIGLMSGTSMDGIDAALLKTDGVNIVEAGESILLPYEDAIRQQIIEVIKGGGDREMLSLALTIKHAEAVINSGF